MDSSNNCVLIIWGEFDSYGPGPGGKPGRVWGDVDCHFVPSTSMTFSCISPQGPF